MSLWRVTCPLEERYVIATDVKQAVNIATTNWAKVPDPTPAGTGHNVIRVDRVQADDPWTK